MDDNIGEEFSIECNFDPDPIDRIEDAASLQELAEILNRERADSTYCIRCGVRNRANLRKKTLNWSTSN